GCTLFTESPPRGIHRRSWHHELIAAFTDSGRNGIWRKRTPIASNTALLMTAAVGQVEGSPPPLEGDSGELFTSTMSIRSGISSKRRMGYPLQSRLVTWAVSKATCSCSVRLIDWITLPSI